MCHLLQYARLIPQDGTTFHDASPCDLFRSPLNPIHRSCRQQQTNIHKHSARVATCTFRMHVCVGLCVPKNEMCSTDDACADWHAATVVLPPWLGAPNNGTISHFIHKEAARRDNKTHSRCGNLINVSYVPIDCVLRATCCCEGIKYRRGRALPCSLERSVEETTSHGLMVYYPNCGGPVCQRWWNTARR